MTTKVVIHIAAEVDEQKFQKCSNCGKILKDFRIRGIDFPADGAGPLAFSGGVHYPAGSFIAMGPGWQAMDLQAKSTTCIQRS